MTLKKIIKEILSLDSKARENDIWLMIRVWYMQNSLLNNKTKFVTIQKLLLSGKLAKPESIRRARQKLQVEYPAIARNKPVRATKSVNPKDTIQKALNELLDTLEQMSGLNDFDLLDTREEIETKLAEIILILTKIVR